MSWDRQRRLAQEPRIWELFHENSKRGRFDRRSALSGAVGAESRYRHFAPWALPRSLVELTAGLGELVQTTAPSSALEPAPLDLEVLATLLYCAAGAQAEKRFIGELSDVDGTGAPDGLPAIDLLFHTREVRSLPTGLYAYLAEEHELRQLVAADLTARIVPTLTRRQFSVDASLLIFFVGHFQLLIDRYGDRGYRLAFAQLGQSLMCLAFAANALGIGYAAMSEYRDRELDALLGVDGHTSSTLQVVAIGAKPSIP